jgi:Kef-type K+ transport system membrane component KefB/voltage-gated potassium channel Kch
MHNDVFTQLSLVIAVASVVSLIMRVLHQPLIMGYILTGIVVGPSVLGLIHDKEAFDTFSEIGIALLLFIIGLELSVAVVRRLGKPVILTALALLSTVGTLGYLLGVAFHFTQQEAILMGLALFFSSTIIIAKVLSDKKELARLNGQIAIGVILIDDIIATFALLFVAAQSGDPLSSLDIGLLVLKGIAVIIVLFICGTKLLPPITRYVAKSQELLFLFALAWGFGVASIVNAIGFSVEVGALFAGVTLAHLPYTHQIGARLKPLRDFFIILFFISLGERLQLDNLAAGIVPALILSAIVIAVKPIVVMTSLGLLGYTKRTSFKTGINLSQISEFSIILIVLANAGGLVGDKLSAVVTLVAIITIAISTYLMKYDDWLYTRLENKLRLFERSETKEKTQSAKSYELILFGYRFGGHKLLKTFHSMKQPYIVVDYDPEVIEELSKKHIPHIYGDVADPELLNEINLESTKLIINTIDDHVVNTSIARYVRRHNKKTVLICYANDHDEAAELYKLGVTYVLLPNFLGSEHLNNFIVENGIRKKSFEKWRKEHLEEMNQTGEFLQP